MNPLNKAWNRIELNEAANKSLSRFFKHFNDRDIAIISASRAITCPDENGNVEFLTDRDNKKRNRKLENAIKDAGYGYVKVKGSYEEDDPTTGEKHVVSEDSFVVLNTNKDFGSFSSFIINQGSSYDQESVLLKPAGKEAYLFGTNSCSEWIKKGQSVSIGNARFNNPSEVFTQIHGGRQFSFGESDVHKYESAIVQKIKSNKMAEKYGANKKHFEESSLSRVWQHITNEDSTFAVISAFLGDDDELDLEANKKLARDIRALGLGYIPLNSGYSYSDPDRGHDAIKNEKSYFIPNISWEDAKTLGAKYNQEAILWKDPKRFILYDIGRKTVDIDFSRNGELVFDEEIIKIAFSALIRANKSQKGRKFAFKTIESIKEMRSNSVGSYKYKEKVPRWINII